MSGCATNTSRRPSKWPTGSRISIRWLGNSSGPPTTPPSRMYQAETCAAASLQARFRSPREIRLRSFWQRPHRSSPRLWNILEQPLHRRLRQQNQESGISALHGSGALSNPTPDHWFELTAFQPTTDNTGTYGNSGRDILRAPGIAEADLSLVKNTR